MRSILNHNVSAGLLLMLCIMSVKSYEIEDIPFDKESSTERQDDVKKPQTDELADMTKFADELKKQRNFSDETASRLDRLESALQLEGAQQSSNSQILERVASEVQRNTAQKSNISSHLNRMDSELQASIEQIRAMTTQLDNITAKVADVYAHLDEHIEAYANTSHGGTGIALGVPKATPRDCSELPVGSKSGVYLLQPGLASAVPVPAFCDMENDGGNWTVIQRRGDIQRRTNFYRNWIAYKEGFGELNGEFWWGLENIWYMTSPRDRTYQLRIDMEDLAGRKAQATYQNFRISSEADAYRLDISDYSGDAGDSLGRDSGSQFSTKDVDHTPKLRNCAQRRSGAWWFRSCGGTNLNGKAMSGRGRRARGITWRRGRRSYYVLKADTMKIRPNPVV